MIGHILERAFIHIFMDVGLVIGLLCPIEYSKRWLAPFFSFGGRIVLACMILGIIVAARETIDVHNGQPYIKAFTDWFSHVPGIVGGFFAIRWLVRKDKL